MRQSKRRSALSKLPDIFGQNVRKHRESRGWSLEQLAKRVGLSKYRICEIEYARFSAGLELVEKIANGLNLAPAVLLEYPPEKPSRPAKKRGENSEAD